MLSFGGELIRIGMYDFRHSRRFLRALCHLLPDTFAVLEAISAWRPGERLSFLVSGPFLQVKDMSKPGEY